MIEWFFERKITFVFSASICKTLPYCTVIKLNNGETEEIPKTLRIYRNSEIIEQFRNEMKYENVEIEASDSLLYSILNICPASRLHSLECVDLFVVDGMKASKFMK